MDRPQSNDRSTSFDAQARQRRLSVPEQGSFLEITRTRSHELTVAEGVAVQEQDETKSIDGDSDTGTVKIDWHWTVKYLLLLTAFLTSTSFGVTQVPLLYVFRLMTCDAYYQTHASPSQSSSAQSAVGSIVRTVLSFTTDPSLRLATSSSSTSDDRCSVTSIESSTALNIALLGASTTIFGILNLFITGNLIKRIGLKQTLVINVGFPAVRLFIQNVGVEVWGTTGIIIVQCSQFATVLGGPSGYLLVLNSFMTEVVEYEERTAALGRVAGSMMFGSALGYLLGGVLAEDFSIQTPFRVTLVLFLVAAVFVAIFLPYVPPTGESKTNMLARGRKQQNWFKRFFAPLLVFTPKMFINKDGITQREYGMFLLACGVFLAILATGYLATLLQLYATDAFNFGTKANGYLIFLYSLLRGVFLTFAFPSIIAIGRKLTAKRAIKDVDISDESAVGVTEQQPLLSAERNRTIASDPKVQRKEQTFAFDLFYTRFSLLADGVLTLMCTFVAEGWQMYLVAAILPFSAGTGSAAKGTVLQMVGSTATVNERTDALAGLSLVENMARLATTFVFGVVFAAFAGIGKAGLTFIVNAGVAVFGFLLLCLARFPPESSRRVDQDETEERSENE